MLRVLCVQEEARCSDDDDYTPKVCALARGASSKEPSWQVCVEMLDSHRGQELNYCYISDCNIFY